MYFENSFIKNFNQYEIKKFIALNFWVAGTTFFKALTQLVTLKIIAFYLGAQGIGVFGQAASCVVAINSLFSSGLLNFSVSEISRNENNAIQQKKICSVISLWILSSQLIFFIAAIGFAEDLSQYIFSSTDYKWFFYTLAGVSLFFNLHSVSTGFLSALGEVKKIFMAHFAAFLTTCIVLYILINFYNTGLPLVAAFLVLVSQSLWLCGFLIKTKKINFINFRPAFEKSYVIKILKFSMIMVVTGLLGMIYQIYMRNEILKIPLHGWSDVGEWQAVLKVSEISMSFLGLSIMTSYFPQISKLSSLIEIKEFIMKFSIRFGLLIFTSITVLIILSDFILHIIYNKSFIDLSSLLRLQLFGDIFKLFSWLFTYFFLAKLPLFMFLVYEALTLASLTVMSIILINLYGVKGLVYAHCINSALFFVIGSIFSLIILNKGSKWIR